MSIVELNLSQIYVPISTKDCSWTLNYNFANFKFGVISWFDKHSNQSDIVIFPRGDSFSNVTSCTT